MAHIEFHFDFGSPNAYLSHLVIPDIQRRMGARFTYVPVLLGGVFKLTNNRSPAESLAGIRNNGDVLGPAANRECGADRELLCVEDGYAVVLPVAHDHQFVIGRNPRQAWRPAGPPAWRLPTAAPRMGSASARSC